MKPTKKMRLTNKQINKMERTELITAIWERVKRTHNEKDRKDLNTFTVRELKNILRDCEEEQGPIK